MPLSLTTEQILALAPDASAAKAGKELANGRKWQQVGVSATAAWGECQGSAKEPYRTVADLHDLAFRCTCPSRKLPCKHALGLLLLLAREARAGAAVEPPEWVATWLAGRAKRAEARAKPATPAGEVADPRAAERRAASREARVRAGLGDLDRWLRDVVRRGLAAAQTQPYSFWDGPAARLVDAQAPGLARRVRALAGVPQSGGDWPERLLGELGLLHLAVAGYRRLDTLPPAEQADVRAVVGWTHGQDEVLTGAPVRDHWLVLGQHVSEEDKLRVQRTWLWGQGSGRAALVLHFAAAKQPLDASLVLGTRLDADLAFYPSAYPLRALVKARHAPPLPLDDLPGYPTLAAGLAAYAAGLAAYPWLDLFPLPLTGVVPVRAGAGWAVRDAAGQVLPLSPRFTRGWHLLALSGGQPLGLFGEWDGAVLRPLGVWAGGRYHVVMRET
jgi:hypothetical protein